MHIGFFIERRGATVKPVEVTFAVKKYLCDIKHSRKMKEQINLIYI